MSTIDTNIYTTFSKAFKKAVDKTGLDHVDIYSKLGMDKSQFSKIYNGEIEKPQSRTREKLCKVVGVDIINNGNGWIIQSSRSQESVNDPKVVYADKVELPKDGKLSRDQMKDLLGQIEVISRILKDSL